MIDNYIYVIVALLPLTAAMVIFQKNPYHSLVIRGILGAVSALVYAVLGAADVALTEALVGTMLAITLYAIAVRSSLVMRVGILQEYARAKESDQDIRKIIDELQKIAKKYYLRLELITYFDKTALESALNDKEVHLTCTSTTPDESDRVLYQAVIRIHRLYEILKNDIEIPELRLSYLQTTHQEEKHS
ncbi:MAG: DUF4040 domain-containing protein [Snowella sp.]|nr:DUF4040 domain-containing protein [Snowella sp.]